jgi:hypothetical protein
MSEENLKQRRAADALRHRLTYAQKKHASMQTRLSSTQQISHSATSRLPEMADPGFTEENDPQETHASALAISTEAHTSAIAVSDMTIPHLTEEQTSVIAAPAITEQNVPQQTHTSDVAISTEAHTSAIAVPDMTIPHVSTQISILRQQPSAEVCNILIFHSTEPERSISAGTHTNADKFTENAHIQSSVIG